MIGQIWGVNLFQFLRTWLGQFKSHFALNLVNIAGLALGVCVFILIGLYGHFESSFDKGYPDYKNIYRLETSFQLPGQDPIYSSTVQGGMQRAVADFSPNLISSVQVIVQNGNILDGAQGSPENVYFADPNFFEVFPFEFLEGDGATGLANLNSVILSQRKALQLFGPEPALGKTITIDFFGPVQDFVVAAVFKDLPENTHFINDIMVRLDETQAERLFPSFSKDYNNQWGRPPSLLYFKFNENVDFEALNSEILRVLDLKTTNRLEAYDGVPQSEFWGFTFVPLEDLHLEGNPDFYPMMKPGVDQEVLQLVLFIGFLTLGVAVVNFINLLTARSDFRAKEISLRKTFGARRRHLIFHFLGEAAITTLLALSFGFLLALILRPFINEIFSVQIGFQSLSNMEAVGWFFSLFVLITVLGGGYPALVLANTKVGNKLASYKASRVFAGLRKTLVIFQFFVAIGLVLGTFAITTQIKFIQEADTGYPKEGYLVFEVDGFSDESIQKSATLIERLRKNPKVLNVSRHYHFPGTLGAAFLQSNNNPNQKPVSFQWFSVDNLFFETYGIQPMAGRVFSEEAPAIPKMELGMEAPGERASAVINLNAAQALGFSNPDEAIGKSFFGSFRTEETEYVIVGVTPDINWETAKETIKPNVFFLDQRYLFVVSVRFDPGSYQETVAEIEKVWQDVYPTISPEIFTLSEIWDSQMETENLMGSFATALGSIAVFISILGLFSQAQHYQRTEQKNLSVRKVHGASTLDLVKLQLREFSKPALIATPLAWGVAWYFLSDWLTQYSYRISLDLWLFFGASIFCILVSWIFIAVSVLKTAMVRPGKILRVE